MLITKEITIDLLHRGVAEPVEAVQCDANTRAVKVTLLNGGESWTPPSGAVASVAFKKPDGTSGWYDKLPDNSAACTVAGNAVTAVFAPQMLTAAGKVNAAVIFQDRQLNQLATFVFTVEVQANPAAGKNISNDYYKYATMEQMSAAVDAWLTETEAEKNAFLSKADAALEAMREVVTASDSASPILCEKSGQIVSVSDSSDRPLRGLTLYGKTTQNGTPTPTNPVALVSAGNGGSINATVAGKNILPQIQINGTFTGGERNIYTANSNNGTTSVTKFTLIAGVSYTLSATRISGSGALPCLIIRGSGINVNNYGNVNKPVTVTAAGDVSVDILLQAAGASTTVTVGDSYAIQLEMGNTATAFEPYKGGVVTATTPNGLPGIPVTSGGNYTDENGQQWICDEVDFARGVYVKRITKLVLKGSEAFIASSVQDVYRLVIGNSGDGINVEPWETEQRLCCSHFRVLEKYYPGANRDFGTVSVYMSNGAYELSFKISDKDMATYATEQYTADNPVTVIYPGKPIETALSAQELAAYYALHSNKPNTTVLNDAGAGMKLSYVADTKLYIDNKFGELAAALVNKT